MPPIRPEPRWVSAFIDVPAAHWTVMRDPAGMTYCLTDRNPVTGKLPALT